MQGIEVAFEGTVVAAAELRTAKSGREWLSFAVNVPVRDDQVERVSVAAFAGHIRELAPELRADVRVYVQGKASVRRWQGCDGQLQACLSIVAEIVQPLGLIGESRPKRARTSKAPKSKPDVNAPLPFNDPIPF